MRKRLSLFVAMIMAGWFSVPAMADGYVIYPVPQEQVAVDDSVLLQSGHIQVVCGESIDSYTKQRIQDILTEHGLATSDETLFADTPTDGYTHIYIGVNGSGDVADNEATRLGLSRDVFSKAKYDRHAISINNDSNGDAEIVVLGEHCDAAFMGLASIEQILDAHRDFKIPAGIIYDYADQKNRGIVEGYYGIPYSFDVTKDLLRFMMRFKMNSYMYGAKDDTYHKGTNWKVAYPTTLTEEQEKNGFLTQEMMRQLNDVSHETKVSFIWSIHTGNDFLNSSTVVTDIINKYKMMYNLGVRQFGIFTDDVGVPSTDAEYQLNAQRLTEVQNQIDSLWNVAGATPADTVKPIQFVPHIYCRTFASSDEQEKAYFEALASTPAKVDIYTTGYAVWSVPNTTDVNRVRNYLGRDVAWWWNYPCNDPSADSYKLFTMDMYSNFLDESNISNSARPDLDIQNCLGILSNPMQEGEAAKIALFSIADYTWNSASFNNEKSWEAAFYGIFKGDSVKAKALRTIAPYLRTYDSRNTELTSLVSTYKALLKAGSASTSKLPATLQEVQEAVGIIEKMKDSADESESLLYTDIKPWLLKLRDMLSSAQGYMQAATAESDEAKWNAYVNASKTFNAISADSADYLVYTKYGDLFVTPSNETLLPFVTYLKENVLGDMLANGKPTRTRIYSNLADPKGSVTTVKGITSISNVANTLGKGEYIGLELPSPTRLDAIFVADTLAANHTVFLSTNGKDWRRYTTTDNDFVRYICVVNETDTPQSIRLYRTAFSITLPTATELNSSATTIPSGTIYSDHTADYLTDGDYTTWTCLNRNQQTGDAYTVKLKTAKPIHDVRVCVGTVNSDYMTVGNVQVSADGKTWKTLKVKGTSVANFRMTLPQVVKYSDEMSYCDFDGTGDSAQYVRLYVSTANTSKWLRLYEIQVNLTYDKEAYAPDALLDDERVETLTDELGYTSCDAETSTAEALVYYFYNARTLSAVRIYQDAESDTEADLFLTDDGFEWTAVGQLTGGLQVIDTSQHPQARQLKIEWAAGNAPHIYEIQEVVDDASRSEVTKIGAITNDASADVCISSATSGLQISSLEGIASVSVYGADGRLVLKRTAVGQTAISVPLPSVVGIYIVRVSTTSGQVATAKVQVSN